MITLNSSAKPGKSLAQNQCSVQEKTFFENPEFGRVDCFEKDNNMYFRLSDIASVLGVDKGTASKWKEWADSDEIELRKPQLGGHATPYGSESLLYRILNRSNSPKAKPFERWITKDVIPSIRKNGIYATDKVIDDILNNPDFGIELLTKLKEERQARIKAEGVIHRIADGKGCYTINQTAKALKLPYGNIKLFEKLRAMQILNHDNSPKQEQINNGNFKVVVKFINEKIGNKPVTLTTSKGLVYLAKKLNTEIDESVLPDYE